MGTGREQAGTGMGYDGDVRSWLATLGEEMVCWGYCALKEMLTWGDCALREMLAWGGLCTERGDGVLGGLCTERGDGVLGGLCSERGDGVLGGLCSERGDDVPDENKSGDSGLCPVGNGFW